MSNNVIAFNPLDKANLGASVAQALVTQKPLPLGALKAFRGAGIYAIYYNGGFRTYSAISKPNSGANCTVPIYVGKAIPVGARKGLATNGALYSSALFNRLREHQQSIEAVENLDVADFKCRYLVVDDIWIPLGESLLINQFAPLWNSLIDGFGNHDPGSGRYNGLRPRWDVLHPGRSWAEKCKARPESMSDITRDIDEHFRAAGIPRPQK